MNRLFFFFWYRRFTFQFTFAVYLSSQFPLLLFLLLYIKWVLFFFFLTILLLLCSFFYYYCPSDTSSISVFFFFSYCCLSVYVCPSFLPLVRQYLYNKKKRSLYIHSTLFFSLSIFLFCLRGVMHRRRALSCGEPSSTKLVFCSQKKKKKRKARCFSLVKPGSISIIWRNQLPLHRHKIKQLSNGALKIDAHSHAPT